MTDPTSTIQSYDIDHFDPRQYIIIKRARVNNLKNLSVAIPRNKLIVITGVSGSGKSSLAFDTLFAEGQRMYVESLSSYARQFLGRMEKPEVDYIRGVSPAISIEQKVNTRNPRSTVGTTTEIYDYLKLLFSRIGKTYSPVSGREVVKHRVSDVVDYINSKPSGERFTVFCPLVPHRGRSLRQELDAMVSKGYTRLLVDGNIMYIEDIEKPASLKDKEIFILIDRAVGTDAEEEQYRFADSIETAFFEGHGECYIQFQGADPEYFSDRFEMDGIIFEEPSVNLFSFNNPYGACRKCEGFGKILGIDEDLVIPDQSKSVYEGAVLPWNGEMGRYWLDQVINYGARENFPIHRPYKDLSTAEREMLWKGSGSFDGIDQFFEHLESKKHKIQYRVLLSRYRGRTTCPDCRGTRLRKDASYIRINDRSITDLVLMPVDQLAAFFRNPDLSSHDFNIAERILKEINNRLSYMSDVGLGYLTLNRLTSTLSGGEYQRIKLATSLGSALVGSMYILDEPSIGLHPRDTRRLVKVLESLRNEGNTVIVVEHEEEVMRMADQIIDIGPDAGSHGGELVFQGTLEEMMAAQNTYTAAFLSGKDQIALPEYRRKWRDSIIVRGARENNLKNIDVKIPLGVLTMITGVSGSGKSTLVKNILYPALGRRLGTYTHEVGKYDELEGDVKRITQVEFVDQNPIGKSSRSNPVTYVKAYDAIRQLFSQQPLSKNRGYKPSHFSFNVEGGRCETCQGEGVNKIEMQFMADIYLTCEDCKGKRFKSEILDVQYNGLSIHEVLELTVSDSIEFFSSEKSIVNKLRPLYDVGLGYIRLGQSSNTLSGGEAQRVKLASFLGKTGTEKGHILFIFDEPTTGLHFNDIRKLLKALNALIDQGNSVLVIEHNLDMIKTADWIIDLGPDGGEKGGSIVAEGTPEEVSNEQSSITGTFLKEKLGG